MYDRRKTDGNGIVGESLGGFGPWRRVRRRRAAVGAVNGNGGGAAVCVLVFAVLVSQRYGRKQQDDDASRQPWTDVGGSERMTLIEKADRRTRQWWGRQPIRGRIMQQRAGWHIRPRYSGRPGVFIVMIRRLWRPFRSSPPNKRPECLRELLFLLLLAALDGGR